MSLPACSTQAELFSTAGLAASLFPASDRYRLFAKLIYPHLAGARATLANGYGADHGRVAMEPVRLLGAASCRTWTGCRIGRPWTCGATLPVGTSRSTGSWATRGFIRPAW